jgi:hypothetical protein
MAKTQWFKGNIHTHTTMSDGDADPRTVVRWYRQHDYDFLVLSDHNHLTIIAYAEGQRRFKRPLMVPGEELSIRLSEGTIPVHINGIGINRMVEPIDAGDIVSTLQANVDAIHQAGGIASINHPNYQWAFDDEALKEVVGANLLEIFNGVHLANVEGAPGRPSYEQIWDGVLSAGRAIFGVAADDSHNYSDFGPNQANPGRGWVVVRAEALSSEAIVDAMAAGDFYASTGVALSELYITPEQVSLTIEPDQDSEFTTAFTGRDGKLLHEQTGMDAKYDISGDEGYVRATVHDTNGKKAWTQPVFTAR